MRLHLDGDRCQGHGRCYVLAPTLFGSDDEGFAILLTDGTVPPADERRAETATANCPEYAISIETTTS